MLRSLQLRQERNGHHKSLMQIIETAESENRGFTQQETKETKRLEKLLSAIDDDILAAQIAEDRRASPEERSGAPSSGQRNWAAWIGRTPGEPGEIEVGSDAMLTRRQRVTEYLQTRGLIKQHEFSQLSFGNFLRAAVLGPKNDIEKRALAEGTDSAGGYTVPDITAANFIDKLRAKTVCLQAGAQNRAAYQ